jgi:hypothetical protein
MSKSDYIRSSFGIGRRKRGDTFVRRRFPTIRNRGEFAGFRRELSDLKREIDEINEHRPLYKR